MKVVMHIIIEMSVWIFQVELHILLQMLLIPPDSKDELLALFEIKKTICSFMARNIFLIDESNKQVCIPQLKSLDVFCIVHHKCAQNKLNVLIYRKQNFKRTTPYSQMLIFINMKENILIVNFKMQ